MMRIKRLISSIVSAVLILLFVLMILAVVLSKLSGGEPNFFGYQLKSVLSGSMEPSIHTGSIIAIKPGGDMTRFEVGDVITYRESEERLITHRIAEVTRNDSQVLYRTKGDNNDAADLIPVSSVNVVGEYTGFTLPYAGYVLNYVNSKVGGMLMMVIPGVLLLLYAVSTTWKAISRLEPNQAGKVR